MRVGAEQEMFLIDRYLRPAPVSLSVLEHANDQRLTTEIARFNLEANLTPSNSQATASVAWNRSSTS